MAPTQSVCDSFAACWVHFLNRILQVEPNIRVGLSHRALRHTTVYYYCNLPEDHYHSIGQVHIFLFQYWDLFYSRASVLLAAATIVHLFRTFRRTSAQCRLLCSIRLDSCKYGRERSLISRSHLLFIDRISRVCCLQASTLHYPVAPRVLRTSHRIAAHHNGA